MVTELDLASMALALAGAKTECTDCDGTGRHQWQGAHDIEVEDCGACNHTGEVYVLDKSVRVECDIQPFRTNYLNERHVSKGKDCKRCDGRRWNPLDPRYLGDWMVALAKVFPSIQSGVYARTHRWYGITFDKDKYGDTEADTPELALMQAAMRAVGLSTEEE